MQVGMHRAEIQTQACSPAVFCFYILFYLASQIIFRNRCEYLHFIDKKTDSEKLRKLYRITQSPIPKFSLIPNRCGSRLCRT